MGDNSADVKNEVQREYRIGDSMLRLKAMEMALQTHGQTSPKLVMDTAEAYFAFLTK